MLWFALYGASILFLCYVFLDLTWRLWIRRLSFVPSLPSVPWLGSVPYFPNQLQRHEYELRNMEKFDRCYLTWYLSTPIVAIGCVEYIEPLLKSKEAHTKSIIYDILAEWLGYGILISKGEKWKKRRVALTGAFHFNILNDFMDVYEKYANNLVEKVKNLAGNKVVDVQSLFSLATLDVICETSMGVQIDALNSPESEYSRAVEDIKRLAVKRVISVLGRSQILYPYTADGKRFNECLKILHNFTVNVINENIALRKKSSGERNADTDKDADSYRGKRKVFIDILFDLYDKGEIDVEGMREEVDTFMFAGHDTSSTGLSWILYEIGRHPDIQKKIQEEVDEISSKDCSLTEKIRLLKYTECVVKESLRLRPPVPGYARKLDEDTVLNGRVFPAGTVVRVDTFGIHLNPEYWDDPYVFNPSRFSGEVKRHPYCYVPFSAGPRNCIGQKFALREMMVFIYVILSNFNVRSTQSPDELIITRNVITHSLNGINIEFSEREL